MTWQLSLAGLLVGILVGMTGMGGGSLMTPILILVFGFDAKVAVGTDILHGAVFKSFGAVRHRMLGTAGLTIDVRRLLDEVFAVLLMAIVAVLVCIAGVAGVVHLATGMDIVVCLLLGAVVSTTDPAAVIGIFRDVGAPKRLSILAEGESLLNDAVAIAAFGLFIGILVRR